MNLTKQQSQAVAYYKALALPTKEERKAALRGLKSPDPRVNAALCERGLLARTGWNYGPIYDLTEAGMAV